MVVMNGSGDSIIPIPAAYKILFNYFAATIAIKKTYWVYIKGKNLFCDITS
jgi:hypothetical protein